MCRHTHDDEATHATPFKILSSYIVLSLSVVACVTLFVIIMYLIHILQRQRKKKTGNKIFYLFMAITISGITAFLITALLIMSVILQIILLDTHQLHDEDWIDHTYCESFEIMEYLIAIFDTFGHLCVVLLFIARYEYTFRNGVYATTMRKYTRILYTILGLLFAFSIVIVVLIVQHHNSYTIIVCEIVWELMVEVMCVWVLYLFVSRLYNLLKSSFDAHFGIANDRTFSELTLTLIESIKCSKEKSSSHSKFKSKSKSKSKSKTTGNVPKSTTKHTACLSPQSSMRPLVTDESHAALPRDFELMRVSKQALKLSRAQSLPLQMSAKLDLIRTASEPLRMGGACSYVKGNEAVNTAMTSLSEPFMNLHPTELVRIHSASPPPSDVVSKPKVAHRDRTASSSKLAMEGAADLIGVMNKMTLLVSCAVLMSILSVIGNVFVEIHALKTIEKHDIDTESLWAEILPLMDIVVTSFMLYLQFNFADEAYRRLLGRLDTLLLKGCLSLLTRFAGKVGKPCENEKRLCEVI